MNTPISNQSFYLLVVDDNPLNQRLLRKILTKAEYLVDKAESGMEALQSVQKRIPDLILLDIIMPDMDGYEVCSRLRANEKTASIPVVFISGLTKPGDMIRAFAVGGVDFIAKPFHSGEVLARVNTHLTMTYLQRQLVLQNTQLTLEIEERRQVEEELRQATEEAQVANRTKSQFLANVSHEIRTPMNAVLGMTEILLGTDLNDRQQRYAQTIFQSSQSLLAILNDLLDFSKIEANSLSLEAINFDLFELMHHHLANIDSRLQEKGLRSKLEIDECVPQWVCGDSVRLGQIMCNLLSNAVKFTEAGTIVVRLATQTKGMGLTLRASVSDSGIGISEQVSEKLFHPFSQADNSTTRRYGGTGLGLSITKRLVEMMGGGIRVVSKLGEGSTFHFWIHLQQSKGRIVPHILVVEEDPVAGEWLASLLGNLHYSVDLVDSVKDAHSAAENKVYSLVFLDMSLSNAVQETKHFFPTTTIIGLNSNPDGPPMPTNVQEFLQHPIRAKALQKKLEKWLK